ncbi:hypothetical protein B0H10DRAFT_1825740, partial [Mycena sp. CBHHK59/15]
MLISLLEKTGIHWKVLEVPGVICKEHFTVKDPIQELEGPVLADNCNSVCTDCEDRLLKKKVPFCRLANHIWIQRVPWQLRGLSFAEKMLTSTVQHNHCVVRVASGRGKMSANAIMFATPIVKVYNILPLTADELSEVLAFIFLGPARPTEEDFMRTPMLVRQDRVKDALDWLKLNHVDYEDLEILKDNIEALPENGIPYGVDWIETNEGDSNTVPKAMAVHDN